VGGMQLPYSVEAAANAFFACASVSIGSGMLTTGNANLLMTHGTALQKKCLPRMSFQWSLGWHHVPERAASRLQLERCGHACRAGWRRL
jgi:hypothetical protein